MQENRDKIGQTKKEVLKTFHHQEHLIHQSLIIYLLVDMEWVLKLKAVLNTAQPIILLLPQWEAQVPAWRTNKLYIPKHIVYLNNQEATQECLQMVALVETFRQRTKNTEENRIESSKSVLLKIWKQSELVTIETS